MSVEDDSLFKDVSSLALEVRNVSAQIIQKLATESVATRTLFDTDGVFTESGVNNNSFNNVSKEFDTFRTTGINFNILTESLERRNNLVLDDISTTTFKFLNNTSPEVKISKPEVLEDSGLGTPEYVVFGACIIVVVLACLAIILRIVMPIVRPKLKQNRDLIDDISSDRKISGSSGFPHFGGETDSHSSGSDSSQSQDWSEVSSDQTRSTDADEKPVDMAGHYGQLRRHTDIGEDFRGSSSSLPTYLTADSKKHPKSNKNSPTPPRRKYEDLVSVVSSQSLEPIHMEDNYRSRWDDQWDPYGVIPRGNLSHLSHPSESRTSLSSNSTSSLQSNARFPTPSRQQVYRVILDKERRYPTKSSQENIRQDLPAKHFKPISR